MAQDSFSPTHGSTFILSHLATTTHTVPFLPQQSYCLSHASALPLMGSILNHFHSYHNTRSVSTFTLTYSWLSNYVNIVTTMAHTLQWLTHCLTHIIPSLALTRHNSHFPTHECFKSFHEYPQKHNPIFKTLAILPANVNKSQFFLR